MFDVNATFLEESAKLSGSHPIDLYCINASRSGWEGLYYANINQNVYGYELDSNGNLTNTATIYTGLPLVRERSETNITDEIPEVSISIPNTDRIIESFIQNRNYLRGLEVYLMFGFASNLPSGSTAYHIGTNPDKNAFLKEKLFIDSVTSTEEIVTFVCKSKFNIKNVVLPKRFFSRTCQWAIQDKYLGSECDPYGNIDSITYPTCDGTLDNCRVRRNEGRFGGFPAIPRRGILIRG